MKRVTNTHYFRQSWQFSSEQTFIFVSRKEVLSYDASTSTRVHIKGSILLIFRLSEQALILVPSKGGMLVIFTQMSAKYCTKLSYVILTWYANCRGYRWAYTHYATLFEILKIYTFNYCFHGSEKYNDNVISMIPLKDFTWLR